jgi:tubulin polyglutamylase TTLL5
MLDDSLKCWLIEVNSSPSLEKDFMIDEIIKQQLVDDAIEVVEPVDFDRA